jgi:hypothetical protein
MSFVDRHEINSCKTSFFGGETKEQNEALPYDNETSVNMYQKSQSNWSKYGDLNGDGKKDIDDLYLTNKSLLSNSAIDRALYFDESPVKGDGNCFYHAMVNYIVGTGDFNNIFMQDYCNQYEINKHNIKKAYGGNKNEYRKMYMMHWLRKKLLEYHQTNSLDLQKNTKEKQEKHLKAGVDQTCLDTETNTKEGWVGINEWSESWEIDLMARYLDIVICTFFKLQGNWAVSTSRPWVDGLESDVCFLYNNGGHFTNLTFKDQPDGVFWTNERERIMKKLSDKNELKKSQKKTIDEMSNENFESYLKKRIENNCWNNYRYTRDIVQEGTQIEMPTDEKKKRVIFHIMTDIEGPKVNDDQDVSKCKSMLPNDKKLHYDQLLMKNKRNDRIYRFKKYMVWAKEFLEKWDNANIRYNFEFKFQQMLGQTDLLTKLSVKEFNDELKIFFPKEIGRIDEEGMGHMTKRKFQKDRTFKTHAKIIKENGDTYQTDKIWKLSEKETKKATNEIRKSPEYDKIRETYEEAEEIDRLQAEEIARLRSIDNVLDDIKDKTEQDIYFKQMAVFLLRHYQLLLKPKKALPGVFLSSYPNFEWKFEDKKNNIACGWRWKVLIKKGYRTDEQMEPIRKTHSLINELNELGGEDGINLALGSTPGQLEKLEKIIKMAKRQYIDIQKAGKQMIKKNLDKPELSWDDPWSENHESSLVPTIPPHDTEEEEEKEANHWNPKAGAKASEPPQIFARKEKTLFNYYGYAYYAKRDEKSNPSINTKMINTWESIFNNWTTTERSQKANKKKNLIKGDKLFLASLRMTGSNKSNKGVRPEFKIYKSSSGHLDYFRHLMKWANLFGWEGVSPNDNSFKNRLQKTAAYLNRFLEYDDTYNQKKENEYTNILTNYQYQVNQINVIDLPEIDSILSNFKDGLFFLAETKSDAENKKHETKSDAETKSNAENKKRIKTWKYTWKHKNAYTAIMLIDFVWRQWLQDSHVGKRYLIKHNKTKKTKTISESEVIMDNGIFTDDEYTSRNEYDTWFQTAINVYILTDPSGYTSNNTSNHFEEMKRIKNTHYQALSEQQLLTLFVENIKNIRYFTMMQLLSNDQFNEFLIETGGDNPYPSYNFGYNCFHFLGYRWLGMGQDEWESSKKNYALNESNNVAIAPPTADNIYKRNTLDPDDY